MRTVTLELPDNIADQLEAMPPEERNQVATDALTDKLEPPYQLTQKDKEDLKRSFEDVRAGRVVPAEEVYARAREVIRNRKRS